MCKFWELTCKAGEAAEKVTENILANAAQEVLTSIGKTLTSVGTMWVNVSTPTLKPASSTSYGKWPGSTSMDNGETIIDFIGPRLVWLQVAIFTGCLIWMGVKMMWSPDFETVRELVAGWMKLIIISGAGAVIINLAVEVCDAYSKWIISEAVGSDADAATFAGKILDVTVVTAGGVGIMVILVAGLLGLLSNLVQTMMIYGRSAMLVLLVAFMPVVASAAMTNWGKQWLNKLIGWLTAFLAFKPVAATIYAIAIRLVVGTGGDDEFTQFILGIIMMILAALALPAMVSFLTPVAAGMGSGGSGGVGGLLMAANGAVAVKEMASWGRSAAGHDGKSGKSGRSGRDGADGDGAVDSSAPASGRAPVGAVPTGGAGNPGATGAGAGAGTGASGAGAGAGTAGASGAGAGASGGAAAGAGAAAGPVGASVVVGAKATAAGVRAAQSTADEPQAANGAVDAPGPGGR